MSTEDNKAAVRQFYEECFNKHNLAASVGPIRDFVSTHAPHMHPGSHRRFSSQAF